MAATEELRILLRTIADTSGITKTEQALKGVQSSASTAGRTGATSLLQFGAAAGIATVATDRFVTLLGDSIQATRDHERILRATTASYGAQTAQWSRFADQLSATTGLTSDAILEAALSARTLSQNYGLSIQQTQELIKVSADLSRIRGIGVAAAFERVQGAIRGEAEASEYLGLTLGDTFMKNQALNGSLKNTWETLSETEKAQVRYTELLKQSADFQGLAADSADNLDLAFGKAAKSTHNLQLEIGELTKPATIAGLNALADALDFVARGGVAGAVGRVRDEAQKSGAAGGGSGGFMGGKPGAVDPYLDPAVKAAYIAEQARRERDARRLREINELPTQTAAADLARLATLDQIDAAVRDLVSAQQAQLDLQRQSVSLSAEEARIKLALLPAQERMAALQRDVTESAIRARQAALPATEALDDLRYAQQVAQLTASNRNMSPEERSAARRDLRAIGRAIPGAELDALVAGRPVTLADRAATRVGMQGQLQDIGNQRALAGIEGTQTQTGLLAQIAANTAQGAQQTLGTIIADAIKQGISLPVTLNVTLPDGSVVSYSQLIEAADQAQMPPSIPQSGVRR